MSSDLLHMLSELQWHYEPYDDHYHKEAGYYCPVCGGDRDAGGHKPGCDLHSMLVDDQQESDHQFYTKQLHSRSALILNLDPENTSWFEIVDEMEKTIKGLKAEVLELLGKVSDVSQQAYEAGLMDGANQ